MKKVNFLFSCLLLWMVGMTYAMAKTVTPYKVDFNSPIDTEEADFAVAPGWDHQAPGIYNGYSQVHPYWTYSETGGNGDTEETPSGWLSCGTQNKRNEFWDYVDDHDYLITPVVNGKVTFSACYVYASDLFFRVYTMKEEDGKLVIDQKLLDLDKTKDFKDQSRTFYQFEIPNVEGKRLCFYFSNCGIDDFEAESAEIPEVSKLTIKKITPSTFGDFVDADETNNYTVNFQASVTNTGNVTLTPGMENYSLSVLSADGSVIKTVAMDKELKPNESTTVDVAVKRSYTEYPNKDTWTLRDDLSKKTVEIGTITPGAYAAAPVLTPKFEGDKTVAEANFNKTVADKHMMFSLKNVSGQELKITSVTAPEGYKLNIAADAVVAKHDSLDVDVTLLAGTAGKKEGDLVIATNQGDLTVKLKGEVAPETTWYADFEAVNMPVGTICDKSAWTLEYKASSWKTENDQRNMKIAQYGSDVEPYKFITPLLDFAEGETFEMDLARNTTTDSYGTYNFSILYSDDRVNWTSAKEIKFDDLSSLVLDYTEYQFKHFVVDNIPAGKHYIAIAAVNGKVDNLIGGTPVEVAHDWMVSTTNFPSKGQVNNKYTATATLLNNNLKAEEEGAYKVELYVNDEAVAEAEAVKVEAGAENEYTFTYTPHEAGEITAKVVLTAGDYKAESTEATVIVNREESLKDVTIGTVAYGKDWSGDPKGYSEGTAPMYHSSKYSESESLLPASMLAGQLNKGDKISRIKFTGTCGTDGYKANVKIWMENTTDDKLVDAATGDGETSTADDATTTKFVDRDTTQMTQVFDGEVEYARTYTGWSTADGPLCEIVFDEPFVYDGNGLRLRFVHKSDQECYDIKYEKVADNENLCFRKNNKLWDSGVEEYAAQPLPVYHFVLQLEPAKVVGKVTDNEGVAIANANITLKSDDVEYYATTAEDGTYSVDVIQSALTYKATAVSGEFMVTADEDVVFGSETSKTVNFTLPFATGINTVTSAASAANTKVYSIEGIKVSDKGLKGLKPGLYIVNGKKVVVK